MFVTNQSLREGEAELTRLLRSVDRVVRFGGAEAMANPSLHPHIAQYCATARRVVASLAPFRRGANLRRGGQFRFQRALASAKSNIDSVDGLVRSRIGQYSRYDLDILLGCFGAYVEQAFRAAGSRAPGSLRVMRNAAAQRIAALRAAGAP